MEVKKVIVFYFIVLLFVSLAFPLSSQILSWGKQFSCSTYGGGDAIVADSSGNIYISGLFEDTTDFDPGPGKYRLISKGHFDVFVCKLDPSGKLIWAKSFGGPGRDQPLQLAVDPTGNVYITGVFHQKVDFNPGSSVYELTSNGFEDVFITKLNKNGQWVWTKSIGGTEYDQGNALVLDESGHLYIGGVFASEVDFDPGPGTNIHTSAGYQDAFILKLDLNGEFVWVKKFGGSQSDEECRKMVRGPNGHLYVTGLFRNTVDFDPGPLIFNITSLQEQKDIYLLHLDSEGQFVWAKHIGGTEFEVALGIASDKAGNIYYAGYFRGTVDFDPGQNQYQLTNSWPNASETDAFVSKLDFNGNLLWVKKIGGSNDDAIHTMLLDTTGSIYMTGSFESETIDFDPGPGEYILASGAASSAFLLCMDTYGHFRWVFQARSTNFSNSAGFDAIALNNNYEILTTGFLRGTIDFDPSQDEYLLHSEGPIDITIIKYRQRGVRGSIFWDKNENCNMDTSEIGLINRRAIIQPGNFVLETNELGNWNIDMLPVGDYTVTYDTIEHWQGTCRNIVQFTIANSEVMVVLPPFGMIRTGICTQPEVSVFAPTLRPCFPDQKIFVKACNLVTANTSLVDGYVILTLDSLLTVTGSSSDYFALGQNMYQINIGTLQPDTCLDFWVSATLSCNAEPGQTICMEANLFPVDSCAFPPTETYDPPDPRFCAQDWDHSSLVVTGQCRNDSIVFNIVNSGLPGLSDMFCYVPYRIYADARLYQLDSVSLSGGQNYTIPLPADGRTWRLETDQHPMHPGHSNPSITVERCGNADNWTPGIPGILPEDDGNPMVDIYCGLVTASYDPNDKTGYPLGSGPEHIIAPNGKLDYVIRFQNTGTDTAFTVFIRDTLDTDVDIFSLQTGISSHPYTFRMFGQRVLEWTFDHIMLPDSNINAEKSNGFVTYTVRQNRNLSDNTEIQNAAAIYFDYNDPIITNTTMHKTHAAMKLASWDATTNVSLSGCHEVEYGDSTYHTSGSFWQVIHGSPNSDTLVTLLIELQFPADERIEIVQVGNSLQTNGTADTYQWVNCHDYSMVTGETTPIFLPEDQGDYALITIRGSCADTSACANFSTVGTTKNSTSLNYSVYPNPTTGIITLGFETPLDEADILITNPLGELVSYEKLGQITTYTYSFDGRAGIYLIRIRSLEKTYMVKVFKN